MLLTAVLLKVESFAEMQPLKGIYHNTMYKITGYTIEQINCDDNKAYEDLKSAKKDYLVEIKGNMLKASVVHEEGDRYIYKVRNGRPFDKVVVDPNEVYMIERYYRIKYCRIKYTKIWWPQLIPSQHHLSQKSHET